MITVVPWCHVTTLSLLQTQHYEYERWKAERDAIDEARLSRGRTNGGAWRREWDNDKVDQG